MASRIPLRPDDKSACKGLDENERNTLTYYVLFGCSKEAAFELHNAKRLVSASKIAITRQAEQFFKSPQVKAYIEAYKDTLERFLAGESKPAEVVDTEQNASDRNKKRKLAAAQKIIDYVINEANGIAAMEDPESFVKLADKVGLFDSFEQAVEAPRRYLPETCNSCRFYQFCTSDDVIDECQQCRYKAYANENGVYYDHKNMLNGEVGEGDNVSLEE